MNQETWGDLTRVRDIPILDRLSERVKKFSPGDRIIFYVLVGLVGIASILGLYKMEQSLLETIPAYGGTLGEGEVGSPQFINPLLAITDADRDLSALAYSGLMGISGSGNLVPILASGYTESTDGKTYTFTLNPKAKFSDGTSVTANQRCLHGSKSPRFRIEKSRIR